MSKLTACPPVRLSALFLCALLMVVNASEAGAQEPESATTDGWTPELSMQYKTIQQTAMSPDGSLIAYVVRKPIMAGEKSEYLTHIWVVSADGEMDIQYTHGEKSAGSPAFSPDGTYLAFTSSRSGDNQIWIMRVRGGEAEQLTDSENGVGSFSWSPDGRRIAYTMRDPDTEEEKEAEKEKRDVILVDQNYKYSHLYTVSLAEDCNGDHKTKRLTAGDFHVQSFDWSPDGTTLVFAHAPDPTINTGGVDVDLSTVPADSGAVSVLFTWPGADQSPRYSPDGEWIAFVSHGGSPQRIGLGDLYVIPSTGGEQRKLAETWDRSAGLLGWSANGRNLLISESFKTTRHLFAVPVDGGSPQQLTTGDGVIGAVSFDRNTSEMSFTYQEPELPVDVYRSSVNRFALTKLTSIHDGIPRPPMGKTELLTWSSPDGLEIEGLLTYPVDYEEGRAYPLILNIHGGPAGVFSQSFTGNPGIYMLQYFAQSGYAILRPNPRGSSGYGKEFRYANFMDWGYGDYEDLMSGVDLAVDMGVAHADSLLVMGWSYGGYMTSFLVTKTDRFQAASMGAGLPNLISMVSTTDIPDYLVAHFGGEFWDDYETYEKHSAMYRIANVTIPTQVVHGQNDLRVPFTQGQEFYTALRRRGVPTEMVVYPRTPHGPREPKLLMDVSQRIMKWFERFLDREIRPTTD